MNNGFPAKTVSLEINPPVDADFEKLKKRIDSIAGFIDFVNVTSCPMGKLRPSAVASAYFIQNRCGVKTVANITCRDSNLLGLASELLGADLLGIKNINPIRCLYLYPPSLHRIMRELRNINRMSIASPVRDRLRPD